VGAKVKEGTTGMNVKIKEVEIRLVSKTDRNPDQETAEGG
jgi:hypothetical protein